MFENYCQIVAHISLSLCPSPLPRPQFATSIIILPADILHSRQKSQHNIPLCLQQIPLDIVTALSNVHIGFAQLIIINICSEIFHSSLGDNYFILCCWAN